MRLRIVAAVHDPPVWILPSHEIERIAAALPEADVIDARDAEVRRRELPRADILLGTKLTPDEARLATQLKWIQSTAVGVGPLLRPEIVEGNVVVTNARGVHARFIAEHAIALTLAVRRSLHVSAARQHERVWAQAEIEAIPCAPADESRLLVIGLGEIGSRIASMAAGLGFVVHAIRRRPQLGAPPGVTVVVGVDHLIDELGGADAVVLAAPTTSETRAMIGRGGAGGDAADVGPRQCRARQAGRRGCADFRADGPAYRRRGTRCIRPGASAFRAPALGAPERVDFAP